MTTTTPEPAAAPPAAPRYACPRCGKDRGADTRILCADCWKEAPQTARKLLEPSGSEQILSNVPKGSGPGTWADTWSGAGCD